MNESIHGKTLAPI